MTNSAGRPAHLPDYKEPPLTEVVLGVQFSPAQGYQQIRAGEVWGLFREKYPEVQEHPALPPTFETFGLPHQRSVTQFAFGSGVTHDRFWFVRPDGTELVQFQHDRLFHNWRKVGDNGIDRYPRFESMVVAFEKELTKLQDYFATLAPQTLAINQCEIAYINQIHLDNGGARNPSDWLRFVSFEGAGADDFSVGFREVIRDSSGKAPKQAGV